MFAFLKSQMSPAVDTTEAITLVAQGKAVVIDVREEPEVRASGKAKGALTLPLSQLTQTADPNSGHFNKALAKARAEDLDVFLYCASGARSGRAADILRRYGFVRVHNIGSLSHWHQAGGPVVR